MQILPTDIKDSAPAFIKANGSEPEINPSSPFAGLLESISNKAREQAGAMAPDQKLAASRKAARHAQGEHGLGQGLKVSREDFASLREKLAGQGLGKEDIQALEDRIASKEGLTWKDMLQFVADKLDVSLDAFCPEITASMRNDLSALFDKLGFTHEQGQQLLQDLENGKQRKVWHILSKQTASLPDEALQQITRGELRSLSSALGLPPESMQRLDSMLAGDPNTALNAKGARLALNTIFSESAKLQNSFEEKLGELRGLIEEGLQLARKNKDMHALADNKESKDISTAKVLIKDEAEKNFRHDGRSGRQASDAGTDNAAEAAKKQNVADKAGDIGKNAEAAGIPAAEAKKTALQGKTDAAETDGKPRTAADRAEALFAARDKDADAQHGGEQGFNKDSDRKAFDDMWSRIVAGNQARGETAFQQAERIVNQTAANASLGPEISLGEKVPPQGIARTVQNGILQNLQQGGKQLTLRLDPPSLGKLTVILQVHNNEVRATIRTENAEAAKLVNEQANLIRHTLEQQGLKVEKLDVQTQTQNNDQNRNWQGAEQHNQAQDRNRESLQNALRNLHRNPADSETLAHEMQSPGAEEISSQQRLHLIA